MDKAKQVDHSVFHIIVLAVIAGFVDTVGFLSFGAFAGLMTGNTVLLGISLAYGQWWHTLHYVIIITSFLVGVALSCSLKKFNVSLLVLFSIEAIALVIAVFLEPNLASYTLAFAMGLQNAAVTHFVGIPLNTVFLTGNLQRMVLAVVDHVTQKSADSRSIIAIFILWGSYLCGAALGAQMQILVKYPLLLAPMILPLVFMHRKRPKNL